MGFGGGGGRVWPQLEGLIQECRQGAVRERRPISEYVHHVLFVGGCVVVLGAGGWRSAERWYALGSFMRSSNCLDLNGLIHHVWLSSCGWGLEGLPQTGKEDLCHLCFSIKFVRDSSRCLSSFGCERSTGIICFCLRRSNPSEAHQRVQHVRTSRKKLQRSSFTLTKKAPFVCDRHRDNGHLRRAWMSL